MARFCAAVVLAVLALSAAGAEAPQAIDAIRDHLARGMVRTASGEIDALLRQQPANPGAWELLAELRLAAGEPQDALEAARKAVETGGGEPRLTSLRGRACLEVGLQLRDQGRSKEATGPWFLAAEQAFRQVLDLDADDPDARWRFGLAKEWQGDHGLAEQFYDLQIEKFPNRPVGYLRMGRLLANRANWAAGKEPEEARQLRERAHAAFQLGIEKTGEDPELLFTLGEVREEDGAREPAMACYLRSARAGPEFKRAWDRVAERADPAEVLYPLAKEVLATHPTAAIPAMWAGHCANRRKPQPGEKPWGRHVEALSFLLPALAVHGEHEGLYVEAFAAAQQLLGTNPRKAPDPEAGLTAFQKIHDAWPWSGDAANNLGFYYREAGKYDLSLRWYLRAVERAPENQDILNDAGLIYLFHFPAEREKGLPFFLKTVALVEAGDQEPERGYWDALENLCKHYSEVDRKPEKVIAYAKMRYETTKGVRPYNMSPTAEQYAKQARKALGR